MKMWSMLGVVMACGPKGDVSGAVASSQINGPAVAMAPRAFDPRIGNQPVIAGISYGPYREGQAPGGPDPSAEQILEDLQIIATRWPMIRMYGSGGPAETALRMIREHDLPIQVMIGAWIAPDASEANARQVADLVRLANEYDDVVFAVNVGNESQVAWSGHRVPADTLLGHLRAVRQAVTQPVTTADDYNYWNKPESHALAKEVDFLLMHAYAMWNQQSLDDAVAWTAATVSSIAAEHPHLRVVIGETGWATELNPESEGDQVLYVKGSAGEQEQARFYREFTAWAAEARVPYFYFEAFDEPWKGSDDPREIEKHWGLYRVDRTPKPALQ